MDREELTDLISDAISDSIDMDWNSGIGARHVVDALLREGLVKLVTADELLESIDLSGQPDSSRLVVMAQNPADNHHWSKSVGKFTAGQVREALAKRAA